MNILVTNYDDSGEDVCIINTSLNSNEVETALKNKKQSFSEVYEVPDRDLQYYIYDPLYATKDFDNSVKNNTSKN